MPLCPKVSIQFYFEVTCVHFLSQTSKQPHAGSLQPDSSQFFSYCHLLKTGINILLTFFHFSNIFPVSLLVAWCLTPRGCSDYEYVTRLVCRHTASVGCSNRDPAERKAALPFTLNIIFVF